jgi:hypothetical protein
MENIAMVGEKHLNRPDEESWDFIFICQAIDNANKKYSGSEYLAEISEISNKIRKIDATRDNNPWDKKIYFSDSKERRLDLFNIPLELSMSELCLAALAKNVEAIHYVPEELKTLDFYILASLLNFDILDRIPKKFVKAKTLIYHLYRISKYNRVVPRKELLDFMSNYALSKGFLKNWSDRFKKNRLKSINGYYIAISKKIKNPEFCLAAVRVAGYMLEFIPEKLKTFEVCLAAIENYPLMLALILEKSKTWELCLAAVKNNGTALIYVPERLRTTEICLAAVKSNILALNFVPEKLRTPGICLANINQNFPKLSVSSQWYVLVNTVYPVTLEFVSSFDLKNTLLIKTLIDTVYFVALKYVPEEFKTAKICRAAVKKDRRALQYIPEKLRTKRFYFGMVNDDGLALEYVPEEFKTLEICRAAVKKDKRALQYIPEKRETENIYFEAVYDDGLALEYVPKKFKTPYLCLTAVKKNKGALKYVPKTLGMLELFRIAKRLMLPEW